MPIWGFYVIFAVVVALVLDRAIQKCFLKCTGIFTAFAPQQNVLLIGFVKTLAHDQQPQHAGLITQNFGVKINNYGLHFVQRLSYEKCHLVFTESDFL